MTKNPDLGQPISPDAAAAIESFRTMLARMEANSALRGYQRAQRLREFWAGVEEMGMADEPSLQVVRYEAIAWDLRPGRPTLGEVRGSHWRPAVEYADGSRYPDVDAMPDRSTFFALLAERVKDAQSPIHRARYADLLWEMEGGYQHALAAAAAYIESAQMLPQEGRQIDRQDAMLRALQLSLQLRRPQMVLEVKQLLLEELEESERTGYPPLSLQILPWLLEIPKPWVEPAELMRARKYAEDAAARYRSASKDRLLLAREAYRQVVFLARRLKDIAGEHQAILSIGSVIEEEAAARAGDSHLAEAHLLEEALAHYVKYGISDRIDTVKLRLRAAYRDGEPGYGVAGLNVPIDVTAVDRYASELVGMSPMESLTRFLSWRDRIPSKGGAEAAAKATEECRPILSRFPVSSVSDARRVSRADTPEERHKNLLFFHYHPGVQVRAAVLSRVYRTLADAGRWTADTLVDFLATGIAFDREKLPLLRAGVERYLARDYASAIFVLVPQIEDVLRRLVGKLGLPTTSYERGTGLTMEISLGQVLEVPQLANGLGEDLLFYVRFLFLEQQGENLRNDVAHGLLEAGRAQEPLATLVVDTLLILRGLHLVPPIEVAEDAPQDEGSVIRVERDAGAGMLLVTEGSTSAGSMLLESPSGARLTPSESIRLITDRLVHEFHPLRVIVFGSNARSEATLDSDVDILVVLPTIPDQMQAVTEIKKALADLPISKDVIVATPEDIERRRDRRGDVLYDAVRQGRVLYDREQ